MAEYIEREKVLAMQYWEGCGNIRYGVVDVADINDIPAADVAPVVHGKWIGLEYDGYADCFPVYDLWECSECGEEVRGEDVPDTHPFCHGCGAKMGGGNDDG